MGCRRQEDAETENATESSWLIPSLLALSSLLARDLFVSLKGIPDQSP
jgi:hypothetical protein